MTYHFAGRRFESHTAVAYPTSDSTTQYSVTKAIAAKLSRLSSEMNGVQKEWRDFLLCVSPTCSALAYISVAHARQGSLVFISLDLRSYVVGFDLLYLIAVSFQARLQLGSEFISPCSAKSTSSSFCTEASKVRF